MIILKTQQWYLTFILLCPLNKKKFIIQTLHSREQYRNPRAMIREHGHIVPWIIPWLYLWIAIRSWPSRSNVWNNYKLSSFKNNYKLSFVRNLYLKKHKNLCKEHKAHLDMVEYHISKSTVTGRQNVPIHRMPFKPDHMFIIFILNTGMMASHMISATAWWKWFPAYCAKLIRKPSLWEICSNQHCHHVTALST